VTESVNEADLLEQRADWVSEEVEPGEVEPGEADPADVRDQQRPVPVDEDDARDDAPAEEHE
jgi:hypothetical protein